MRENSDFISEQIKYVSAAYKKRAAGSPNVLRAMEYMAEQLKPLADEVRLWPFTLRREPFVGSIALLALGGISGVSGFLLSYFFL